MKALGDATGDHLARDAGGRLRRRGATRRSGSAARRPEIAARGAGSPASTSSMSHDAGVAIGPGRRFERLPEERDTLMREARIDLAALRSTSGILRGKVAPRSSACGADEGGRLRPPGAVAVARTLEEEGVDWLGVADLGEALALQRRASARPCSLLAARRRHRRRGLAAHDIDLGVSTVEPRTERAAAAGATVQAQKLDTRLSRSRIAPADMRPAFARAADHRLGTAACGVRGVFSHLCEHLARRRRPAGRALRRARGPSRDAGLDRAAAPPRRPRPPSPVRRPASTSSRPRDPGSTGSPTARTQTPRADGAASRHGAHRRPSSPCGCPRRRGSRTATSSSAPTATRPSPTAARIRRRCRAWRRGGAPVRDDPRQ